VTDRERSTSEVIASAFARCRRIAAGVDELTPLLAPVLPFNGHDLADLGLVERIASVALLKRYEQLQDMVGRLSRAVVSWEDGDARELTHRDLGNWMEKRGFVADADQWMDALKLRNRLVHEYPVDEAEQVARVNDTWMAVGDLQAMLERLSDHLKCQDLA
jgi:hypothetical protein